MSPHGHVVRALLRYDRSKSSNKAVVANGNVVRVHEALRFRMANKPIVPDMDSDERSVLLY